MQDLFFLFVIAVALVGVLWLALGGVRVRRSSRSGAPRLRDLQRYGDPTDATAFIRSDNFTGVLIAAIAGTVVWQVAESWVSASPLTWGLVLGVVCWFPGISRIAFHIMGYLGSAALTVIFVVGETCLPDSRAQRLVGLVIVAVLFALGWHFGKAFRGRSRSGIRKSVLPASLALFLVMDVLRFLSSPLGVDLAVGGAPLAIAAPAVAGVLGFLGGFAPRLVLGLTAVGVAVAELAGGLLFGTPCAAPTIGALYVAVGFCVPFLVVGLVRRRLHLS